MLPKKNTSIAFLTLTFALAIFPKPIAASDIKLAQATVAPVSFELPESIPEGTKLQIDGSSSMATVNQLLKQDFEKKFSGTEVKLNYAGSQAALQGVQDGKVDLAAIGRPLTKEEKEGGLVEFPLNRQKIAIFVGSDNPFNGSLTIEQFVKIFRGEIKDWSEIGGTPGQIRLVDRPESSDTRQAFGKYSVFEDSLSTGANATQLEEDTTEATIAELGKDGIGYAIADRSIARPSVRVLSMYQTTPENPKYPFSQPLYYVYKGPTPSPAVEGFLAYASEPSTLAAIASAKMSDNSAVTSAPTAPTTSSNTNNPSNTTLIQDSSTAPNTNNSKGVPSWLWWLIPLGILAGLLAWLLKNRSSQSQTLEPASDSDPKIPVAVATTPPASGATIPTTTEGITAAALGTAGATAAVLGVTGVAGAGLFAGAVGKSKLESRLILVPRNSEDIYAYWEVPNELKEELKQQGGSNLKLRLYDVTDLDLEQQKPQLFEQFDCDELEPDLHLPIRVSDRDYMGELGYTTTDDRWLKLASSSPVRVPASNSLGIGIPEVGTAIAGVGTAVAATSFLSRDEETPTTSEFLTEESEISSNFLDEDLDTTSSFSEAESETTSNLWDEETPRNSEFLTEESEISSNFLDEDLDNTSSFSETEPETTSNLWDEETPTTSEFLIEESEIPSNFLDEDLDNTSSFSETEPETTSNLWDEETPTTSEFLTEESEIPSNFLDEDLDTTSSFAQAELESETTSNLWDEETPTTSEFLTEESETTSNFLDEDLDTTSSFSEAESETTSNLWDEETPTTSDFLTEESEISSNFLDEDLDTTSSFFEAEPESTSNLWDEETPTTSEVLTEESEIPSNFLAEDLDTTSSFSEAEPETTSNLWDEKTPTTSEFLTEESEIPSNFLDEDLDTTSSFSETEPETTSNLWDEETPTNSEFLTEESEISSNFLAEDLDTTSSFFEAEPESETNFDFLSEESETTSNFLDEDLDTTSSFFEAEPETTSNLWDEETPTTSDFLTEESEIPSTSNFLDEFTETGMATGIGIGATVPAFFADENKATSKSPSRIILIAGNANDAYAYWEVPQDRIDNLKQEGGKKLVLRLYDVTNLDLNTQEPQSFQEFDCEEQEPDLHLPIEVGDRDYLVELGYITSDGRWLMLTRSIPVRIAAA